MGITLELGTDFEKYFQLDGKDITVKDSDALSRNNLGAPNENQFTFINDKVICTGSGTVSTQKQICSLFLPR